MPSRERLVFNLKRLSQFGDTDNTSPEITASLEGKSFTSVSDSLRGHVQTGSVPDMAQLHEGLKISQTLLDRGRPGVAAYYLASLLPLAVLKGDSTFTDQVNGAVRVLLMHPSLTERQQKGFSWAVYHLLDGGAFPNKEEAERLLLSLDIRRPHGM